MKLETDGEETVGVVPLLAAVVVPAAADDLMDAIALEAEAAALLAALAAEEAAEETAPVAEAAALDAALLDGAGVALPEAAGLEMLTGTPASAQVFSTAVRVAAWSEAEHAP